MNNLLLIASGNFSFKQRCFAFFHSFSVSGSEKEGDTHFTVVVDSFIGKLMKVKVRVSLASVL